MRKERGLLTGTNWMTIPALLLALGLMLLPVIAGAAEEATEEATEDYILEDTVVTATKTGETFLQQTPMAITAMDEEFLKNKKSFTLVDVAQYTPNTEFFSTSKAWNTAFIRGVGNSNPIVLSESAVSIYVDGIYMERGLTGGNTFFDVERIEVLRGPQGTLYGRNATGGAINIVTQKPSDALELKIGAEIGSYSKRRFDASISGPIVGNKVKARLTVSDSESDGWIKNLTGRDTQDENYTGVRGAIELNPIEAVEIVLRGDYFDSNTGGRGEKNIGTLPGYVPPADFHDVKYDSRNEVDVNDWGFSGHLTIDLPRNLTLRSITGFRNREFDSWQDKDFSSIYLGNQDFEQTIESFSQEIQLDGRWGKFDALLGAFYYRMEEAYWVYVNLSYLIPGLSVDAPAWLETDAYAAFAHVGYQITDKLRVQADLRYSYEEKSMSGVTTFSFEIPAYGMVNGAYSLADDWAAVTPKFGIDYRLTEAALLYLTASRGFRSGQNSGDALGSIPPGIDPEFIWAYEIGAKTDWFDKRLRANFAVFYNDYTDQQVNITVFGVSAISNAADSTITGAELELIARPLPPLTINFAGSYLDGNYDEFASYDGATGLPLPPMQDIRMPYAPEWKFALGAQWVMPVAELGFVTVRGDMTWTDDFFTHSALEDPKNMYEAHTLLHALLRFETADGRWAVDVYGKNLADEEHGQRASHAAGDFLIPAEPRIFGLQVVFNY